MAKEIIAGVSWSEHIFSRGDIKSQLPLQEVQITAFTESLLSDTVDEQQIFTALKIIRSRILHLCYFFRQIMCSHLCHTLIKHI